MHAAFAAQKVSDFHYQSTLETVYVYVVPWPEFPIVPSYLHYPWPAKLVASNDPQSSTLNSKHHTPKASAALHIQKDVLTYALCSPPTPLFHLMMM